MPTTQTHRTIAARLAGSNILMATFDQREHLVAPVVLLVGDIIVTPITSGAPEFVPACVLAQAPAAWNGRPVTAGHPPLSANDPRTLESRSFGRVFNARLTDRRLVGEVWIDAAQAERVGEDAVSVVNRLRSGQTVEISVGAFVTLEPRQGTANGERFDFVWQHVAPDHLAALPEGTRGACSIADGCGAGRTALAAAQAPPTAADVLDAIARTQYERESRRIRIAAMLDPPPDGYAEGIKKLNIQPLSLSLDSDGVPQPYSEALRRRQPER